MEIHGSKETFNVENVLRQNIVNSDYYRNTCMQLTCWEEIVDEIYESVQHVEPWMSGNARGASSAFCLLYRLFSMKLAPAEIRQTLDHKDSPYIRAVGLLYLRYVCDPKSLWQWYERYVKDDEEFQPSEGGTQVTIGDYARDLLLDQYYFETIFPRIPKKITDDIIESLKARGLPSSAQGNGGQGGGNRRGDGDGNRRPASVKASLSVAFGQRAPNRAGAREEGRGRDPSAHERARADVRDKRQSPEGYRGGREQAYGREGQDKYRERDRDGGQRDYNQSRYGGRTSHRDEQRRRSRSPPPERRRDDRYAPSGRDARDVFRESASNKYGGADPRDEYGQAAVPRKVLDEEYRRRDAGYSRDDGGYRGGSRR